MPPMWLEGRIYLEYLSLILDPAFRGVEVPPGLGRPVLLIPGFLAGDWTLRTPYQWLRRGRVRPPAAGLGGQAIFFRGGRPARLGALEWGRPRAAARPW